MLISNEKRKLTELQAQAEVLAGELREAEAELRKCHDALWDTKRSMRRLYKDHYNDYYDCGPFPEIKFFYSKTGLGRNILESYLRKERREKHELCDAKVQLLKKQEEREVSEQLFEVCDRTCFKTRELEEIGAIQEREIREITVARENAELRDLEAQKNDVDAELAELQNAFDAAQAERATIHRDFEGVEAELETVRDNLEQAQNELETIHRDFEEARAEFATAQNNRNKAIDDLNVAQNNLDQAQNELETTHRRNFEEARAELAKAQDNLDQVFHDLNVAQNNLNQAQLNLDTAHLNLGDGTDPSLSIGDIADLKERVRVARERFDELQPTLQEAEARLNSARVAIGLGEIKKDYKSDDITEWIAECDAVKSEDQREIAELRDIVDRLDEEVEENRRIYCDRLSEKGKLTQEKDAILREQREIDEFLNVSYGEIEKRYSLGTEAHNKEIFDIEKRIFIKKSRLSNNKSLSEEKRGKIVSKIELLKNRIKSLREETFPYHIILSEGKIKKQEQTARKDELDKQNKELDSQIARLEEECNDIIRFIQSKDNESDESKEQLDQRLREFEETKLEARNLTIDLRPIKEASDEAGKVSEFEQTRLEFEQRRREFEQRREVFEQKEVELDQKIVELEQKTRDIERITAERDQKTVEFNRILAHRNDVLAVFAQKRMERDKKTRDIERVTAERDQKRAHIDQLNQRLNDLRAPIQEHERQVARLEVANRQLIAERRRLQGLANELEDRIGELKVVPNDQYRDYIRDRERSKREYLDNDSKMLYP
jgi:chromosome segregation ATPase